MFIHRTRNHQEHIRLYQFPYPITPKMITHHRPMRDQEGNTLSHPVPVDFGMFGQGINWKNANERFLGCNIEGMYFEDNTVQINLFSSIDAGTFWESIEVVLSTCFCLKIEEIKT